MMNALEFMTRFDRDCLTFYETLGSKATDREMIELYGLLADAQRKHLARLEEILAEKGSGNAETVLLDRIGDHEYGLKHVLFDHSQLKALKNDRDAFEHVVHAEEDVIRLFEGMAHAEKSEGTRKILAMLARDEKEHLAEIEEIYDFVEKPDCYLEWGEFSNLKTL